MKQMMEMFRAFMNTTSGSSSSISTASAASNPSSSTPSIGSSTSSSSLRSAASYSSIASGNGSINQSVASSSASVPATTSIANQALAGYGLYGNQEKIQSTLPALKPLPIGADYTTFQQWQIEAKNTMINSAGMLHIITKPAEESLKLAVEKDLYQRSEETIKPIWLMLHEKSCAVLRTAFYSALKDTPNNEAVAAQAANPTAFIEHNANWLWTYAIKQFKPDPIGQILQSLEKLISLRFIKDKSTPSEYNAVFRAALNEIRTVDPTSVLSDKLKLAYYIRGWPAELRPILDVIKATTVNPTVELAEERLQQWYNDYGKGKSSSLKPSNQDQKPRVGFSGLTTNSSSSSNSSSPDFQQQRNRKKKFQHSKTKHPKHQQSKGYNSDNDQGRNNSDGLGALTEISVTIPTSNAFAALNGSDGSNQINSVSSDGAVTSSSYNEFLLDSGAAKAVVCDYSLLQDPEEISHPITLSCALGKMTVLKEKGKVPLNSRVHLNNAYYAKGARLNAMSVAKITDTNNIVVFTQQGAKIVKKGALASVINGLRAKDIMLEVPRVGDLYIYTRPGSVRSVDEESGPAIESVVPPSGIPRVGESRSVARPRPSVSPSSSSSGDSSSNPSRSQRPSAPSSSSRAPSAASSAAPSRAAPAAASSSSSSSSSRPSSSNLPSSAPSARSTRSNAVISVLIEALRALENQEEDYAHVDWAALTPVQRI
jgi:hypothetical protein